ncbi:endonuclease/exonuclease/phosphatase family protein [Spongisporangium articulatum]|uniref:Endonuclease/exonuclease/phosphatase family protein n=1 Tax=Spongisporangium articulatum TaxID=3362603 RepID=A0ABW8APM9_9ACTN
MARDAGGPGPSRRRRRSEPLDWLNAEPSTPTPERSEEHGEGSLFQPGQARAEGYRPGSGTEDPPTGRVPNAAPLTRREARARRSERDSGRGPRRPADPPTGALPRTARRPAEPSAHETGRFAAPPPVGRPADPVANPVLNPFSREAYEAAPETGPLPLNVPPTRSPVPPPAPRPGGRDRSATPEPAAPRSRSHPPSSGRPASEHPSSGRSDTRSDTRSDPRPSSPPDAGPAGPPARSPRPAHPLLVAGLTGAAAVLLAWAAVPLLDSAAEPVTLLATFCPLVTVAAIPVLALSASRRALLPGVLAGLAAVGPWLFAAGYAAAGPGPNEGSAARTVRVMYVDGNHGRLDADSITAAVREQGVDVLVMSGMSDALSHDVAVAGLNRLLTPRWVGITSGRSDGLGVWSRQGTVTMESVPSTGAPTAQGLVTTPAGTFELIATSIPGTALRPGAGWRDALEKVSQLSARSPHRVLVGDLASTPWHPAFRRLGDAGWHDAADVNGRGLRPSWPAWSPVPVTPLDHVMVGDGMGVSGVDSARIGGTPDRAVVASVVVPG